MALQAYGFHGIRGGKGRYRVAHEMLGYTREELLNMSIADIDPNYPADGFTQFWNEQPEGSSVLFETLHRHKDGRLIPVEVNGIFFELNGKRRLFGVARDLRVRRESEVVRGMSAADPMSATEL